MVLLLKELRYNLIMFGIIIKGPSTMTYDNESVYKNATIHTFVLNKKMHSISYHFYHEVIACGLYYISKEDSTINFNELFTKMLAT